MHFYHFRNATIPILRFSKRYSVNSFHQISTKRHTKYQKSGAKTGCYFVRRAAKNYKNYATLKFLLTQDHMELEISKRYFSHSFHRTPSKLYENIAYHRGMQAITFLGNRLSFANGWRFEILTWESMGKS